MLEFGVFAEVKKVKRVGRPRVQIAIMSVKNFRRSRSVI